MASTYLAPLLLLLAAFLSSPVKSSAPGAVQKVLGLIDEMAAKSKSHIEASVADYKQFAVFCDKNANEKVHALKVSADAEGSLLAVIEESEAKIGEHQARVVDLSQKISAVDGELYKLQELREKENKDFLVEEKELLGSVQTLEDFSKAAALTQLPASALQQIEAIKNGLSHVIEASFVTSAQREKVTAFLDARDDDGLGAQPPKEASQAETFGRVMDMAETSLRACRKNEATKNHEFRMSKQHLDAEIKAMNEQAESAKRSQFSTEQALAQANKDVAVEKRGQEEDAKLLQELKMDCASKSEDFETDYRETSSELKALGDAKGILTQKFSLVEMGVATRVSLHSLQRASSRNADDAKAKALRVIQQLGRRWNSAALVSLSYQAATDPFGKVRSMVEGMIAKLQQEAADEATQQVFCAEETAKTKKSKDTKASKLEVTEARIEKSGSAIAHLSEDIATLSEEVTALDSEMAEATGLRTRETKSFKIAERDMAESVEACNMAYRVLQKNAEGASFLQKDASMTRLKAKAKDLSGIMGVLRVAETDYAQQLSSARAAEHKAVREYTRLETDSKGTKAVKLVEIKGKESEVKSLKTSVSDYENDRESMSAELGAVVEYESQLKPRCAQAAPPSYAEREAKRNAELEGLNEALSILSQA